MSPNNFSCGCPAPAPVPILYQHETISSDKATVKFRLDDHHFICQVYNAEWNVFDVIRNIAAKFKVGSVYIKLTHQLTGKKAVDGNLLIGKLPHNEFDMIELQLGLNILIVDKNEKAKQDSDKIRLDLDVFYK